MRQLSIVGGGSSINLLLHIWSSAADFYIIILVLRDCKDGKRLGWLNVFKAWAKSEETKDGYLHLNHVALWLQQAGLFSCRECFIISDT